MYRQGDLLFVKTNELPKECIVVEDGIIARGEITGHTHKIRDGRKAALLVAMNVAYIHALKECEIDHQEHDVIILPPGDWKVIRQREYTPEGWRRVAD